MQVVTQEVEVLVRDLAEDNSLIFILPLYSHIVLLLFPWPIWFLLSGKNQNANEFSIIRGIIFPSLQNNQTMPMQYLNTMQCLQNKVLSAFELHAKPTLVATVKL